MNNQNPFPPYVQDPENNPELKPNFRIQDANTLPSNSPQTNNYYQPQPPMNGPMALDSLSQPTEPQTYAAPNNQMPYPGLQPDYVSTPPAYENPGDQYFQIAGADPKVNEPKTNPKFDFKQKIEQIQKFLLKKWWLVLIVTCAIALTFVSIFAFTVLRRDQAPVGDYNNISIRVESPDTLAKGTPGDWKITIENRESAAIENIQVELEFDKSFEFSRSISPSPDRPQGDRYSISRLDGNGQGVYQSVIQFQGITKGNIDEEIVLKGQINYTPEALVRLQNQGKLPNGYNPRKSLPITQVKTRTTAAKVNILMNATNENVPNNTEAEFTIKFQNTSEKEIRDLRISMNYPQGFKYTSSELRQDNFSSAKTQPDNGDSIWNIVSLQRLSEQTLKLRGNVTGANAAKLSFRVDIEIKNGDNWQSISTTTRDITITGKPLVISTKIDGKDGGGLIVPGEMLTFSINYENQGINALKNIELQGSVQDPAGILDWSTAQFTGGEPGNIDNKTVKWAGSNIPKLQNLGVQSKGELRYTIRVRESGDFLKTYLQQNQYVLIPQVRGQSQEIQPVEVSGLTYKSKGDVLFDQNIVMQPTDAGAPANQKRYRVTWNLKTTQNQINQVNVKTRSTLPVKYFDNFFAFVQPDGQKNNISYNPATGEIDWRAGNVISYSGISNPVLSVSFIITTENSENVFYAKPVISGTDDFTAEKLTKNGDEGRAN